MTKFRMFAIFFAVLAVGAQSMGFVDAATKKAHKRVLKKKKKIKIVKKKASRGAFRYTKNEPLMCTDAKCKLPSGCTPSSPSAIPAAMAAAANASGNTSSSALLKTPQAVVVQPVALQAPADASSSYDGDYHSHSGLYFGLGTSMSQLSGQKNISASVTDPTSGNTIVTGYNTSGISQFGISGDFHVGYIHKMGNFGIGGEFSYDPFTATAKESLVVNGNDMTYSLKLKNTLGVAMKVGYFVSDRTMVFGKMGFEQQKTQLKFDGGGVANNIQKTKNTTGIVLGLGTRYMMSKNWAVGAEYNCSIYRTSNYADSAALTTSRVRPSNHALRFTVSYVI